MLKVVRGKEEETAGTTPQARLTVFSTILFATLHLSLSLSLPIYLSCLNSFLIRMILPFAIPQVSLDSPSNLLEKLFLKSAFSFSLSLH
jgi:hypothetical protein